jgi:anhydro-N-acetylmuramic acid kinase
MAGADKPVDMAERWTVGLMSGTSCDGIDVALVCTDGRTRVEAGGFATFPYGERFRARLREILGGRGAVAAVERDLTLRHARAVRTLLRRHALSAAEIAAVGFHGHTILHAPERRRTWQIGDGALLAARTGIDVVCDFRSRDVAEGGEGAPLAPIYHAALAERLERPLAVLNIGGVSNVTWIGPDGALLAFDTGPGNALIDDWAFKHTGRPIDQDGALAFGGAVCEDALRGLLSHPYFGRPPPKSLDRDAFNRSLVARLSPADGAATLTAFTARAVAAARDHLPSPPRRWLVTGGGRHNSALMAALRDLLGAPVEPVEAVGWHGDALEAQAFAYLAVRSLLGLPLSFPSTTGVPAPATGGRLHRAPRA